MAVTHEITYTVQYDGLTYTQTDDQTFGAESNISETIAASASDALVAWACDVSQLKGLFMVASGNMTVETNSGSSPGDTITLLAGVPLWWSTGLTGATNPLTTDVTALYITSTPGGLLTIRKIEDPTV